MWVIDRWLAGPLPAQVLSSVVRLWFGPVPWLVILQGMRGGLQEAHTLEMEWFGSWASTARSSPGVHNGLPHVGQPPSSAPWGCRFVQCKLEPM